MPRPKIIFNAVIRQREFKGKLVNRPIIQNKKYYDQTLNSFFPGDLVELHFKKVKGKGKGQRTLDQNAFYWGAVLPTIAESTGDTSEDLHAFFKRRFLPPRMASALGREIKVPGSTTGLDWEQFGEYLDKIEDLTGIPLPDPKDAGYVK